VPLGTTAFNAIEAVAELLATGRYATEIPRDKLCLLDNRHGRGFRDVGLWIACYGRLYANRVCHRDTVVDLFHHLGLSTIGFETENVVRAAGHRVGGLLRIQVRGRSERFSRRADLTCPSRCDPSPVRRACGQRPLVAVRGCWDW
jgi:hypothetical protein